MYISCHGGLAQLVEQLIYTEKVTGSSPVSPTDFKDQKNTQVTALVFFVSNIDIISSSQTNSKASKTSSQSRDTG